MYILQESLFSFEEMKKYQPMTRLEKIFSNLDITPFTTGLKKKCRVGRHGYSLINLMYAILAMKILCIPTFTALHTRLQEDITVRYACGFNLIGPVPSIATLSRFYALLSSQEDIFDAILNSYVNKAKDMGILKTEGVAIDSSSIEAYEHIKKGDSDTSHAQWGHKRGSNGQDYNWYGYKLHAAVDVESGLPVTCTVTPANASDSSQAIPIMEQMPYSPQYYCMDKGYDSEKIYQAAQELSATAIIPLNLRGQKEPAAGCDNNFTPVCSMGYPMVYWGYDKTKNALKFRCPHICGKVDCSQGSNWCSSSNYGLVVHKKIDDNPRAYSYPFRSSSNWNDLYRKRGSVERLFSHLKDNLMIENIYVRGINKVKSHLMLGCILTIAIKLAFN